MLYVDEGGDCPILISHIIPNSVSTQSSLIIYKIYPFPNSEDC